MLHYPHCFCNVSAGNNFTSLPWSYLLLWCLHLSSPWSGLKFPTGARVQSLLFSPPSTLNRYQDMLDTLDLNDTTSFPSGTVLKGTKWHHRLCFYRTAVSVRVPVSSHISTGFCWNILMHQTLFFIFLLYSKQLIIILQQWWQVN